MFYYLKGELVHRDTNFCVLDCSGVAYRLTVSLSTLGALAGKDGLTVKLYTYLAVREDGVELFGFGSNEERASFHQLTSVSGIGPKVAMSVLSTFTPDRLALAICTEDVKAIAKAPGIGAKTAARIVLELRDKISKEMMSTDLPASSKSPSPAASGAPMSKSLSEATEALMVLGYDKNSVLGVLKGMEVQNTDVSEIIRLALKKLAR